MKELGTLVMKQGDLTRAREVYQSLVEGYEALLGPEHHYTDKAKVRCLVCCVAKPNVDV